MPPVEGPFPLEVKLLVVETGPNPNHHADFSPQGIRGRLDVLFGAKSGWISTINVKRGRREHKIVFTHRTIVETGKKDSSKTDFTCFETVRSLADDLCNPNGSFSLKTVSKDVKDIRYMPYTSGRSEPQEHFNRCFVLSTLRYTVGNVLFEDVSADAQHFLERNPQKWFLGPLQIGVFLSDFLVLFDKLATLLPLEVVSTQDQPSDLNKGDILLQVLKNGARHAPALRAAFTIGIGDLDKDSIRREFVEADTAVKTAMDNACSKLQELCHLDNGDIFGGSVQEIHRELAQSIQASQTARGIATKESDRNLGNLFNYTGGGLIAIAVGWGMIVCGPAVGGVLALEYAGILAAEGLGWGGIAAGGALLCCGTNSGIKKYNADKYIQELDDLHVRSIDIYAFLALATLRRTGQLNEDDERLIKFAVSYAKVFEGADVLRGWGQPEHTRKYAEHTSQHLRQKLEEFRELSAI